MTKKCPLLAAVVLAACLGSGAIARGQATRPAAGGGLVELNFPADVELRVVVDYVARRLGLNVLYDERVDGKKLTMAAPARVPVEALPELLASVLRLKGFALVEATPPGWKRVVPIGESQGDVQVAAVAARHLDAAELAQEVRRLLAVRLKAEASAVAADVSADARTGQVVIVAPPPQVAAAREIIALIDVPAVREETPVRFYKLANTTAADVLDTIRALEGDPQGSQSHRPAGGGPAGFESTGITGTPYGSPRSPTGARQSSAQGTTRFPGSLPGGTGGIGGGLGAGTGTGGGLGLNTNALSPPALGSPDSAGGATPPAGADARPVSPAFGTAPQTPAAAAPEAVRARAATVAADGNTNSIIVVGPPAAQRVYENLIRQLDRRRPQVLVESTIVTLDTSRNFSLGVEIAGRDNGNATRRFVFSSFGLSQVDPTTGRLAVVPGPGINGALLSPDIADVILRALQADSRSKIVASPRVLVNDNATGTLSSVAGAPVTSINANNTISTTSFAGYAEAGTQITLVPHISEKDYLQLEYEVTLSSFTGTGSDGIPPPLQKNTVNSQVTIPDGSTIVVGGLNRAEDGSTVNAVPLLGEIPILGNLFRSRTDNRRSSTLFVFIRPIILRDEEFEDLRFLSERDARKAGLSDGAPASEPLLVE